MSALKIEVFPQGEFITDYAAGVEFNKNELDYIRGLLIGGVGLKHPEAQSAYKKICRLQEIAEEEGYERS